MKDLTQGPIARLLLSVAGTFMVSMITNALFSLVSLYWVGQLGPHAQAAVVLASNPIMIVLALAPIISSGAGVLMAQAVGAKQQERASLVFNEAIGASLVATSLISLMLWINREAFGARLSADHETVAMFSAYFRWVVPAMVLQVPVSVLSAALGATGDLRTSVISQSSTVILRMIVTPLFLFGWLGFPRLGVEGAGLAGFLSSLACVTGLLLYFARSRSYLKLHPRKWIGWPTTLWSVLKIGLPTSLEIGVMGVYLLALTVLLRPFGPTAQASFGIGQRIFMTAIMPMTALAGASSVIASQSFGAKLGPRVIESFKTTVRLGLILSPILFVFFEVFPRQLCSAFSSDPAVIEGGVRYLRISAFNLFPCSVVFASFAALSGLGNTRASLISSIAYIAIVLSAAALLARLPGFTPDWLWELMVVAGCLQMLLGLYFVRSEFRKRLTFAELPQATDALEAEPTFPIGETS